MRSLTLLLALAMAVALPACKECSEDDKCPKEFLGPDYWPLYGRWSLVRVSMDEHEYAAGSESGVMHEITWEADGTFIVEWANEVIQVGHVEQIVEISVLTDSTFLITADLISDCPKKSAWFHGEYTITAATDSVANIGTSHTTGFSFPWGNPSRRKTLRYEKI